ncbi:MAG: type II secretion system major pseudopilin GspG [Planctomycetes bacterium]|nr:type II secretion system major pseudopilin GspG [Planctomycetota bacterium]
MKNNADKKRKNAFTLVEVMAVLVIIGLLAAVAVQNFMGTTDKARVKTTQANLKVLHEQVQMFKLDTGRYPSEEAGLMELIEEPTDVDDWQPGGYIDSTDLPPDGWKNDFIYQLDPESGKPFVVISYGADGEEGGEDYDADIYSTDAF